jgi:glutathione gamma-glutamylcysteinyltransferase
VGRELFGEALLEGSLQGYFRLAQQFHTQSDPAFCGLGSLVCALNALQIDPRRKWKGVWRWFSEELLDCCKSLDDIRRLGLTLDEVACLATCSDASVSVHRPPLADISTFREHLRAATTTGEGPVLIGELFETGRRPERRRALLTDRCTACRHGSSAGPRYGALQVSAALDPG